MQKAFHLYYFIPWLASQYQKGSPWTQFYPMGEKRAARLQQPPLPQRISATLVTLQMPAPSLRRALKSWPAPSLTPASRAACSPRLWEPEPQLPLLTPEMKLFHQNKHHIRSTQPMPMCSVTDEGLSPQKPIHKVWKEEVLIQMHKQRSKVHGKSRNMIPPIEHNRFPVVVQSLSRV